MSSSAEDTTIKPKQKKQAASSLEEVEETVSRISSHKGVLGVMIISEKGNIIHSQGENLLLDRASVVLKVKQYAKAFFSGKEEDSNENNDVDGLSFIRIRTQQQELLIAPSNEYMLVVLHNPLISNIEKSIM
mmetsp:Transcript_15681/g.23756  ORF Transcript_15681/g.23756 Transcript_15681/m.23756 type:complete len:132 (-) Transcript_15681:124-519(-)